MKKLFILLCLVTLVGVFILREVKNQVKQDFAESVTYPSVTVTLAPSEHTIKDSQVTKSLFVPYWAVTKQLSKEEQYDAYLYFGIVPGNEGVSTVEEGFVGVDSFLSSVPEGKDRLVTLRMLDSTQNTAILKDQSRQKKLIASTLAFAKAKSFSGIVLDLELSAIPFDSLVQQITTFTHDFATAATQQQVSFSMTSYGDTFYRLRPFAIKDLAKQADTMLIMAYDFHKARGNPGPNFPLHGQETYGYDLAEMTDDFLEAMTVEKIRIVFGMFGYDWVVDEKGNTLQQGKPLTYHEIQQKFLNTCDLPDCVIKRDPLSAETKITYTDAENRQHVVWFEDPESVAMKQTYLQKRGISSFGYWAYSYF